VDRSTSVQAIVKILIISWWSVYWWRKH